MARDGGDRSESGAKTWQGSPFVFERIVAFITPVAGIAVSEALLYVGLTPHALAGYALTLLLCTLAPLRFATEIETFSAFALVPLFRLVTLGMPPFFDTPELMLALVYAPMFLPLYLFARRQSILEFSGRQELGGILFLGAGLLLAVGLAELEYRILRPEPLISSWNIPEVAKIVIVFFLFVGLIEELLFRGILQRTLQVRIGRWRGLVLVSAIFGLMHAGYGSLSIITLGAVSGVVYGMVYDWTDSIALVTSIHGTLNLFLFVVIPIHGSMIPRFMSFLSGAL